MSREQGEFREVEFGGNQILVLDGRVVEYFKQDQPAVEGGWRWHVNHIAVEAKPTRDGGLDLKIGRDRDGRVWAQATARVPPEDVEAVNEFFEVARRERDRG
jgi:hypothetical protein